MKKDQAVRFNRTSKARRSIVCAVLFVVAYQFIVVQTNAASQVVVLAEPPARLLQLLPAPPEKWRLILSTGMGCVTDYPSLRTSVTREYRYLPPPVKSGVALPEQITRIILTDTGYDPSAFYMFNSFEAKRRADPILGSRPVNYILENCSIIEGFNSEKRSLIIKIESRFIILVYMYNQNDKDRDFWIQQLNLSGLVRAAVEAAKLPLPPDVLHVIYFDELHPENNQETSTPYLTREKQAQRELEIKKFREGVANQPQH